MAQAKPRPDTNRALARGDQAPGHEVDGADVVGIEGMAEAEGVGEDGGGNERGVEAEDDPDGSPDQQVDDDEAEDLPHDGRREAPEDFRDGETGDGKAGHSCCFGTGAGVPGSALGGGE